MDGFIKRAGNTDFDHVSISSTSSGSLDIPTIAHEVRYVKNHPPTKQIIIVVMMAGNAIRRSPRSHGMVQLHEQMLAYMERFPNVEVILCGLLPPLVLIISQKFPSCWKMQPLRKWQLTGLLGYTISALLATLSPQTELKITSTKMSFISPTLVQKSSLRSFYDLFTCLY